MTDWIIPMRYGSTPTDVVGRIVWLPRPDPLPWLVLGVLLAVAVVAAGATPGWHAAMTGAMSVLVATDAVRSYAVAAISGGSLWLRILRAAVSGDIGIVLWVIGAVAVLRLGQRRESGVVLAIFAGFAIAVFSGLTDIPYLLHAEIPVAASPAAGRAGVVITAGLGLGVAAAGLRRIRRLRREGVAPT